MNMLHALYLDEYVLSNYNYKLYVVFSALAHIHVLIVYHIDSLDFYLKVEPFYKLIY